jgi:hypothetical protein
MSEPDVALFANNLVFQVLLNGFDTTKGGVCIVRPFHVDGIGSEELAEEGRVLFRPAFAVQASKVLLSV